MAAKKEPVFTVSNHHVDGCGKPPRTDGDQPGYHSYFENEHGEQWIFWYDTEKEEGWVWGGDLGWEEKHRVTGNLGDFGMVPSVLIENQVALWLYACMQVAQAFRRAREERRRQGN